MLNTAFEKSNKISFAIYQHCKKYGADVRTSFDDIKAKHVIELKYHDGYRQRYEVGINEEYNEVYMVELLEHDYLAAKERNSPNKDFQIENPFAHIDVDDERKLLEEFRSEGRWDKNKLEVFKLPTDQFEARYEK